MAQFSITLPKDWQLYHSEWHSDKLIYQQDGNRYTWTAKDLPYQPEEPLMPSWFWLSPRVAITYFNPSISNSPQFTNWQTVAKWCADKHQEAAIPDETVQAQTRQLTQALSTPEEQLQAIAAFVRDEIRYVAVEIGEGQWQPRPASVTLYNRYGDCKDKTALMRAMLQTLNIQSCSVLANTHYSVLPKLPSPFQFNHCIVGIPLASLSGSFSFKQNGVSGWLFFDPTDQSMRLGDLPTALQGGRGLLATQADSVLIQLPYQSPYRGYLTEGIVKIIKENWTPNFMKYPDNFPIFSFWYPSYIKAKELHFSVKNVPALEDEPYSVSESMLKAQVRCYYGSSETAQKYWEETNKDKIANLKKYCKNDKRIIEIITSLGSPRNDSARAEAAYNWVQKNLKNIDYLESDEKFKDNKNLDDVIKRRYGTTEELNIVFYSLLHQMNIKARMAYVVDRDEGLFLPKAKYWQFDHSLVAVSVDSAKYQFMSPGYPYLPFTHVPRFTEGVQAYVLGDSTPSFINIPCSEPRINRIVRSLDLRLENDLTLQGGLVDSRIGIPARSIRIDLLNKTAAEREEKFRNDLNEILPNAEFDSITVEGLEETGTALKLQCKLQVSNPEQEIGSRLFIKPFSFFASVSNPFQAAKRSSPIMFNYANEVIELLKFELPETWKIEALPADTSFTNKAGYCVVKFSSFGQTLSVQRGFKLNRPNWSTLEYSYVRNLFQARQSFYELACVLKRTDTDKLN